MAADAWIMYDAALEWIGDNTIDLDQGDAYFTCTLVTSSYVPNAGTHDTWADASANELSGSGYTTGGDVATGVTWVESAGTVTWDWSTDPAWTASGGSITARFAIIAHRSNGTSLQSTDKMMCYSLLDNTPADVSVTDGNTLTLTLNASGIFTLAKA